jgi:Ca2+-binding EF-hand superfamily protein
MISRHRSRTVICSLGLAVFGCSHQPAESRAPNESPKLTPAAGSAPPPAGVVSRPGCADHFKAFDGNSDGRVSEDEFNARPHAHPEPMTVFRGRDGDRDGALTEAEFCSGFRGAARPAAGGQGMAGQGMAGARHGNPMRQHHAPGAMMGARCEQHFDAFDADHDAKLTKEEFKAWPHARGDADALFSERDLDHDGTIARAEFCSAWSGRPEPAK